MSISDIYQEYFNDHQSFFETYIKQSSIEKNDTRFSNWRLSYINYLTDVRKYKYNNNNIYFYSILMIFSRPFNQKRWL